MYFFICHFLHQYSFVLLPKKHRILDVHFVKLTKQNQMSVKY